MGKTKGYDMFGNNPADLGACLGRGYCLGTIVIGIIAIAFWIARWAGWIHVH
jgi:hypothetical protein